MELEDETLSEMPATEYLKKTLYNKKRANLSPLTAILESHFRIIRFPVSTEITNKRS